ncbi:MAG: 4-hydroxybenzoate octaprenyltransferase [Betaproteobacteria bacterium]|nr:4-hydroxybenzoate octaprenyltransferase [Betaproteobacteria bacterium]
MSTLALPLLKYRLSLYSRLARFDKPIGTLLLLWPTLWALWLAADGFPEISRLIVFVLGTFLMRSAGCVINDIADRKFDAKVKRTRDRVLTAGKVYLWEAIAVAVVLLAGAALLLLFLNDLAIQYAFTALFVAVVYPYFKRFFAIPQAMLGIAFSFGIPTAFADTQGQVPAVAWMLFIGNFFWTMAYDTIYAMVDRDDDLKLGIRSSAISFGQFDVIAVAVSYVLFLACMLVVGQSLPGPGSSWMYWLGLFVTAGFCVYLTWRIRTRDRDDCFAAFRANNYVGMPMWIALVVQLGWN